jgi:hypothetical protein
MAEISRPYQDELLKSLTDPLEAVAYLNAALDSGSNELFLLALQNVIAAQRLKDKTPAEIVTIENLQLANLGTILSHLGFRFAPKAISV